MSAVAIMQPYAFPYLGYFSLVQASDAFVFYDDVNFIQRGWINRNRLLINGMPHQFTIPLSGASQNKLIQHIELHDYQGFRNKFLKQLTHAYKRAPYFEAGLAYVEETFATDYGCIADLAIASIEVLFTQLGLARRFLRSSTSFRASAGSERSDRLIEITKALGATDYINAASGVALYDKQYFRERGVALSFLRPVLPEYRQTGNQDFVPGLSIIDVLMHNDARSVKHMITRYELH